MDIEIRGKIIETAQALVRKGLVIGTGGNISVRTRRGFLITPSGMDYFALLPDDIVELDLDCRVLSGARKPSIEKGLHAAILSARPDVCAVVHMHAEHCTAVACCRRPLPPVTDNQAAYFGGEIPVADYAPIGSAQLARSAAKALGSGNAALLANHGAVCTGTSLEEALLRCEMLESFAKIFILARMAGNCVALGEQEAAGEFADLKDRYGQGLKPE